MAAATVAAVLGEHVWWCNPKEAVEPRDEKSAVKVEKFTESKSDTGVSGDCGAHKSSGG